MLMMGFPWMLTAISWFVCLWHFQSKGVIYMFNISSGDFILFFSFSLTKNGTVCGDEVQRNSVIKLSFFGRLLMRLFLQSSKNVCMFQHVRLNISLGSIRGVI